ncbi:MAG: protein kinase [Anaeromyxobacter sp.]
MVPGSKVNSGGGEPCPRCGAAPVPGASTNFCPGCGLDLRPSGRAGPPSLLGLIVADRYRLIGPLGEGGMGSVYKAEHIRMGKALAVKILRGDFARDPQAVARFRAEAQLVSRLSHPHTIAVFDFGEIERLGGFYLAMEYVPGRDLAHALRYDGPFHESRAAHLAVQVLGSLAEAHEAGIVHRDMKPGNLMLMQTRPGEDFVKVLDFGIAKLRDDAGASTTSVGAIVGTPNYLAPEQARGDALDARADLYALGCVLYELISGRPPFVAANPLAIVSAHLNEKPQPLTELVPGVSRRFAELVHQALEKDPDRRFASADAMRDAILALGEPTESRPLRRPEAARTGELVIASREDFEAFERQLVRTRRRRRLVPIWLTAALLVVGAVAWRWGDIYAALAEKAPGLAAVIPGSLRPADHYDGEEAEPNNAPAQANPLPIPRGHDARLAGGVARIRGTVGARLEPDAGDVDVFRIVVPEAAGERILLADWYSDAIPGQGIRGLRVVLTLHSPEATRAAGTEAMAAPVIAASSGAGVGLPQRLRALIEPGTYYLAVREQHDPATGAVEKPSDRYVVAVRLLPPEYDAPATPLPPLPAPEPVRPAAKGAPKTAKGP